MKLLVVLSVCLSLVVSPFAGYPKEGSLSTTCLAPKASFKKPKKDNTYKKEVLADLFLQLAGVGFTPTLKVLLDGGIFDIFLNEKRPISMGDILEEMGGWRNPGYMRVALRLLVSFGLLKQEEIVGEPYYSITEKGRLAFPLIKTNQEVYDQLFDFIPTATKMKSFLLTDEMSGPSSKVLAPLLNLAQNDWGLWNGSKDRSDDLFDLRKHMKQHLNGTLIGPIMVALGLAMSEGEKTVFSQFVDNKLDLTQIEGNQERLEWAFDLLEVQGWAKREGNIVTLTKKGSYISRIAHAYGVTVSYLPTFAHLQTLLFGDPDSIQYRDSKGNELLVDRPMNVRGSGGSHKNYFKVVDQIILDIFNRPIEEQPEGIIDMGSGDGTFLAHLHALLTKKSQEPEFAFIKARLEQKPILIFGADFNEDARQKTAETLEAVGIDPAHFKVVHGDIRYPEKLQVEMQKLDSNYDIKNFLHVRSFLDHNRPFDRLQDYAEGSRKAKTTGSFAQRGREVTPDALEENLVRHLKAWAPFVERFGLVSLELHTLPSEITVKNLERVLAMAYDATHGFSDQYLVELTVWLAAAKEAGLVQVSMPGVKIYQPREELATISINYFRTESSLAALSSDVLFDQAI